jgi:hypothetical protein
MILYRAATSGSNCIQLHVVHIEHSDKKERDSVPLFLRLEQR